MKKFHFRGLDLTLKIPDNWVIHDEGFVRCVAEHHFQLLDRYFPWRENRADSMEKVQYIYLRESYGKVSMFSENGEEHFYIFYKDLGNKLRNLYVIAHEETHILTHTDFRGNEGLRRRLIEIIANFNEFRLVRRVDNEQTADIGAGYALLKNGLKLSEVIRIAKSFEGGHDSVIRNFFGDLKIKQTRQQQVQE